MEEYALTQADLAKAVSKDPSTVANKLRLLKLPITAQILIRKNNLTERHARALLRIRDSEQLMDILETIIERSLNVRDAEQLIARQLAPKQTKKRRKVGTIKDIRLCINTLNHTVSTLRQAGIKPHTQIHDEERFVEYIIRIPKTS